MLSVTPKDFGVPGAPDTEKVTPTDPLIGVPTVPEMLNVEFADPVAVPVDEVTEKVVAPDKEW